LFSSITLVNKIIANTIDIKVRDAKTSIIILVIS